MIGTVEFNSACYYRYANLDVGQFHTNLQKDVELARKTTEAFLTAFVHAVPTGKQNSFAAHQPPSFVFIVVRTGGPVSLANAFVKPITPRKDSDDLITMSVEALAQHYGGLVNMYGDGGIVTGAVCICKDTEAKLTYLESMKVEAVSDAISQAVNAAFAQGASA